MEAKEAFREMKAGKFRPVYVLFGKDRYRMTQFIDTLSNMMFAPEEKEMGIVKFDTAETAVEEAVLEAETPSFFGGRKLVLIRDNTVMAAGGKENAKVEHAPERVLAYLEAPIEDTVLVFAVQSDKLDERRKLVKALKDRKSLIAFQEMDMAELRQWLIKRAAEQGRVLDADGAELLITRIGMNTGGLSQELDKLCLHVGKGGKIGANEVSGLTVASLEEDVFALVDATLELQIRRALDLYKQLLTKREEPIKIAALIARQLRIMLQIKELEQHHYSPQQMAGQLGLHPYAVKLAAEKAKKFSPAVLGKLLSALADLDYGMKTGAIDKHLGLELYFLSLGVDGTRRDVGV